MPSYDLDALGSQKFEELSQTLAKKIIADGAVIYGAGPDGGREATFSGKSNNYPSKNECWDGKWIIQAKFHDNLLLGPKKARQMIISDLENELSKIFNKYGHECNNYILITNVTLTPPFQKGTRDIIENQIIPKYNDKIDNIAIWGADDICIFLDEYPEIRQSYSQFLISGDIVAKLMGLLDEKEEDIDQLIKLYCQGTFTHEKYANLDDSGDVSEERVELHDVFIDLNVEPTPIPKDKDNLKEISKWLIEASEDQNRTSAMSYLLDDSIVGMVIIGGPGEGKSTLTQYLSQIYRARLIGRFKELNDSNELEKCLPRIPFRIILREYAQWMLSTEFNSIFDYIAHQLKCGCGREFDSRNVHEIIKNNPILLVLDGLDEVPNKELRETVMNNIDSFVEQSLNVLKCNLRVIATTRPNSNLKEFNHFNYLHLNLKELTNENSLKYADLWSKARHLEDNESKRILDVFKKCLEDSLVNVLTKTPLQVTMLLFIMSVRGETPNQREDLFEVYTDMIYTREQKKLPEVLKTEKDTIYDLHKYLAFILHRRAEIDETTALMEVSEFESKIKHYLKNKNPLLIDSEIDSMVNQIVMELKERLVLIESTEEGKIGFSLTTIREFFTASFLVDTAEDTIQRFSRFKKILRAPHWRNVVLFFSGRVGRNLSGEESNIINFCSDIDNHGVDKYIKRGTFVSFNILEDRALREQRNIIIGIDYALTILENSFLSPNINQSNFLNFFNPLKNLKKQLRTLPDEQKRYIKQFLEKKIEIVNPENLILYLDFYESLFGVSDIFKEALIKLSQVNNNVNTKIWALKKAIKMELSDQWVSNLLEELVEDLPSKKFDKYFKDFFLNFKWIFNFELSDKSRNQLSKIYLEGIFLKGIIPFEDFDWLQKIEYCPNDSNNNNMFFWAINHISRIFLMHKENDDKYFILPYLADPEIKKFILRYQSLSENFCNKFSNNKDPFIKSIIYLHKFMLNPSDYKNYEKMIKITKNQNFKFLLDILTAIGIYEDDGNFEQYQNDLITLFTAYDSKEDYWNDILELNEIIDEESDIKDHSIKITFWIYSRFNPNFEEFLDACILEKIENWFKIRNLSKEVLTGMPISRFRGNHDFCEFLVDIANKQLSKDEKELHVDGFLFSYNINRDSQNKEIIDKKLKNLLEQVLENYSSLNYEENRMDIEFLYFAAINGNFIEETHIKKLSEIFSDGKGPNFLSIYFKKDDPVNSLLPFLKSTDPEVVEFVLVTLASIKSSSLYGLKYHAPDICNLFWKYLDKDKPWYPILIKGIASSKINWNERKEYIIKKLKSSDEKEFYAWSDVIFRAGYSDEKSKKSLCKLLIDILESRECDDIIKMKCFYRLNEISNESEPIVFEESGLNQIMEHGV